EADGLLRDRAGGLDRHVHQPEADGTAPNRPWHVSPSQVSLPIVSRIQRESIVGERELARIFTVRHSTHELVRFVSLLSAHGVERLVDVRKMSGSRRMPWFAAEALGRSLLAAGIE